MVVGEYLITVYITKTYLDLGRNKGETCTENRTEF